jgi:hypothetical protein
MEENSFNPQACETGYRQTTRMQGPFDLGPKEKRRMISSMPT